MLSKSRAPARAVALALISTSLLSLAPVTSAAAQGVPDNRLPRHNAVTPKNGEVPKRAASKMQVAEQKDCASVRKDLAKYRSGSGLIPCGSLTAPGKAPKGGAATTALASMYIPDWCVNLAYGHIWYFREESCFKQEWEVTIYDEEGTWTGSVTGIIVRVEGTSSTTLNRLLDVGVAQSSWAGVGAGSTVDSWIYCSLYCDDTTPEEGFIEQPLAGGGAKTGQFLIRANTVAENSGPGQPRDTLYSNEESVLWINNSQWLFGVEFIETTQLVRCDNEVPGEWYAGCVYYDYTPTYQISLSGQFSEVAAHISDAILINHLPSTLNRITSQADIDLNRRTACPDSLPRPPGQQCDEYPFASTRQGASTGGGAFSRRILDGSQNTNEGSWRDAYFYRSERLLNGDLFNVAVVA